MRCLLWQKLSEQPARLDQADSVAAGAIGFLAGQGVYEANKTAIVAGAGLHLEVVLGAKLLYRHFQAQGGVLGELCQPTKWFIRQIPRQWDRQFALFPGPSPAGRRVPLLLVRILQDLADEPLSLYIFSRASGDYGAEQTIAFLSTEVT
jgi:hypothetical protein